MHLNIHIRQEQRLKINFNCFYVFHEVMIYRCSLKYVCLLPLKRNYKVDGWACVINAIQNGRENQQNTYTSLGIFLFIIYLSICLSVSVSVYLSIYLYLYISLCICTCVCVRVFACVCLSLCTLLYLIVPQINFPNV